MKADAVTFGAADKAVNEAVEAKNDFENFTFKMDKLRQDAAAANLNMIDKSTIDALYEEAKMFLDENKNATAEEFKAKKEELMEIFKPIEEKCAE